MKNSQSKLNKEILPTDGGNGLYVGDITQYLSGLAKLHKTERTGNQKLSDGLQFLVKVLRPYTDYPVSELANVLKEIAPEVSFKAGLNRNESEPIAELETINQADIEKMLCDESYTKQQITELGVRRFGISRSKLNRLRKKEVVESVRASLEHEKTLDVISQEARKGNKTRLI